MFIIKKGIVAISSEASGSVARLTGGDHFGEVALVMHTKRVASAQAGTALQQRTPTRPDGLS